MLCKKRPNASFFACELNTYRAVQPVSNPECRTAAGTSGACATYRGREGKLRFICSHAAFAAGTRSAVERFSQNVCQR
jgi:hypothetical protein